MKKPEGAAHAHANPDLVLPSNQKFGMVFAAVFALIGVFPLFSGGPARSWALIGSGVFLLAAVFAPHMLAVPNRLWMRFGAFLHRITSPVILGILFFLVITPFGIVMRVFIKDPLRVKFDRTLDTYWIQRNPPGPPPESMKNQF